MRVLVTVASKHGSTGEIGEVIAKVLRDAGHTVASAAPESVRDLTPFDAVILGSAVYAGHWLQPAQAFVERHAAELASRPLWIFSSGPIGDPPMPAEEERESREHAEQLGARGHRTFAGKLDRAQLGFMERAITRGLGAPEGDFRDLEAIRHWADEIASALTETAAPA